MVTCNEWCAGVLAVGCRSLRNAESECSYSSTGSFLVYRKSGFNAMTTPQTSVQGINYLLRCCCAGANFGPEMLFRATGAGRHVALQKFRAAQFFSPEARKENETTFLLYSPLIHTLHGRKKRY